MRQLFTLISLGSLLLLGGCGPNTIYHEVFPIRYTVATTVDFGPGAAPQTRISRCTFNPGTDNIALSTGGSTDGENAWRKFPDGRILVLNTLSTCRFGDKPVVGERRELDPLAKRDASTGFGDGYSRMFDNAEHPTQIDLYETRRLFRTWPEPAIAGARIEVVERQRPDHEIRQAFPGMKSLETKRHGDSQALGGYIWPDAFLGVRATASELVNARGCGAMGDRALLVREDACVNAEPCRPNERRGPCREELGGLAVDPDATYRRMQVRFDGSDPALASRLYAVDRLVRAGAPIVENRWAPEICVQDLCVQPKRGEESFLIYLPRERLLVSLWLGSYQFSVAGVMGQGH